MNELGAADSIAGHVAFSFTDLQVGSWPQTSQQDLQAVYNYYGVSTFTPRSIPISNTMFTRNSLCLLRSVYVNAAKFIAHADVHA